MSTDPASLPITKQQYETARPRPRIAPPNLDAIPLQLRQHAQFVAWVWRRVSDTEGKWRWAKVPRSPRSTESSEGARFRLRKGKSQDRTTWVPFDRAAQAIAHYAGTEVPIGLGFVLTDGDPFFCIDIDDCRNRDTGEITEAARKLIDAFATYAEVSPSGTGVKLFGIGKKISPKCRKKGVHLEIYDNVRFLTMTGQRVPGTPAGLADCQAQLDALMREVFPEEFQPKRATAERKPPPKRLPEPGENFEVGSWDAQLLFIDDAEVIRRATTNGRNGDKIERLWRGDSSDYDGDKSEADSALAWHLAFWVGRDQARIERMMRQSGRVRPKWHDRPNYLSETIRKVCEKIPQTRGEMSSRGHAIEAELVSDLSASAQRLVDREGTQPPAPAQEDDSLAQLLARIAPSAPESPEAAARREAVAVEALRRERADQGRHHCCDPRRIALLHRATHQPRLQVMRCEKAATCEGCRCWLIRRELTSAALHLAQADAGGGLWETWIPSGRWVAFQRRMRRAGAQYLRVRDGEGWWIVSSRQAGPMIRVARQVALGCLETLLQEEWADKRPLSTSHGWSLPSMDRQEEYERIGIGLAGLSWTDLDRIAQEHGAHVEVARTSRSGRVLRAYVFVGHFTAESGRALAEDLCSSLTREERSLLARLPIPDRPATDLVSVLALSP